MCKWEMVVLCKLKVPLGESLFKSPFLASILSVLYVCVWRSPKARIFLWRAVLSACEDGEVLLSIFNNCRVLDWMLIQKPSVWGKNSAQLQININISLLTFLCFIYCWINCQRAWEGKLETWRSLWWLIPLGKIDLFKRYCEYINLNMSTMKAV